MDLLDVGEIEIIVTTWWDENGDPVEPSAIVLTITPPSGAAIVKTKADLTQGASIDVWTYAQTATMAGLWSVHAEATIGTNASILDSMFLVGTDSAAGGPCEPWCTWEEVEACGGAPDIEPSAQQAAIEQGSGLLYDLSGRVYPGLCRTTRSLCFACVSCRPATCSCDPTPGIDVGGGRFPVYGVTDVVIDGVTLDPSAYAVRDRRWLVRLDGSSWPSGWNTADPDRFRATIIVGRVIPAGARKAAAAFVLQIAKACAGDSSCQLPKRFTNIQREGVTFTVIDSMAMIAEGRTGLPLVDLWLVADARGRKSRPRGFHPALPGVRRVR